MTGHQEPYDQVPTHIPLSFSAPFPVTPFENAHKACVKILECAKAYNDSGIQADINDVIIDQFLMLYLAIGQMKKVHPARQLRCDDVEYLIQVLHGVESMLVDLEACDRTNIKCARILCVKTKKELIKMLDNSDATGCIVTF